MLPEPAIAPGRIEAIYVAPSAGAAMASLAEAEAIAGRGLAGDRYATGAGYYPARASCELTLIEAEALDRMTAKYGMAVGEGQHRRNIVTRGVVHAALAGRRFALGSVVVEYVRTRPPCAYLGRLTERLLPRAMGEGAGICVAIVSGGILRVNDPITILPGLSSHRLPKLP
jgi:MOSC domain-containing protein YiiM